MKFTLLATAASVVSAKGAAGTTAEDDCSKACPEAKPVCGRLVQVAKTGATPVETTECVTAA